MFSMDLKVFNVFPSFKAFKGFYGCARFSRGLKVNPHRIFRFSKYLMFLEVFQVFNSFISFCKNVKEKEELTMDMLSPFSTKSLVKDSFTFDKFSFLPSSVLSELALLLAQFFIISSLPPIQPTGICQM